MGSLESFLKQEAQAIEIGEVLQRVGSGVYMVSVQGVSKRAYTTLSDTLSTGVRVIMTKTSLGKRFITSKTTFMSKNTEVKEVFIDG